MAIIVWNSVGERVYETGLDRGVLYLNDGTAVPWNGLTAVTEKIDQSSAPGYFDGRKITDLVTIGDFSAAMKALTYPDEFVELEGLGTVTAGLYVGEQPPKTFALSYRTQIGNDVNGNAGYKIHILYNVTAITSDKAYSTSSGETDPVEFEWEITSVPEDLVGFRPTAHVIIDSRKISAILLNDIEDILYGTAEMAPTLLTIEELVAYINYEYLFKITDNGDGTWSATTPNPALITYDAIDPGKFTLTDADVTYLTPEIYFITSNYVVV